MKILIFVATAMIVLHGCASITSPPQSGGTPVPASRIADLALTTASATKATILITRDEERGRGECLIQLAFDGKDAASLGPGKTLTIYAEPGSHVVSTRKSSGVCNARVVSIEVLAEIAKPHRYRIGYLFNYYMIDIQPMAN